MAQSQLTRLLVRHIILVKAVAVSFAVLMMLLTITIPFFKNAREMSTNIEAKRKESQELADKVSILAGLDDTVLTNRVNILDKALPPRKDVVLYLSTIDGLSRELNLNFGGISLSPGEVTEASGSAGKDQAAFVNNLGLNSLETDISITGSEENIYTFLRLLEESTPLMQIKDVTVAQSTEDTYSLSLKLGMLYALTDINKIKGTIALFDEKEEQYFQTLDNFRRYDTLADINFDDTGLGKINIFENTSAPSTVETRTSTQTQTETDTEEVIPQP